MRLKMTEAHNVLVQLEGKDGAYNAERIAWYDGGDGWQVMVYEFAAGPDFEKITDTGNNAKRLPTLVTTYWLSGLMKSRQPVRVRPSILTTSNSKSPWSMARVFAHVQTTL